MFLRIRVNRHVWGTIRPGDEAMAEFAADIKDLGDKIVGLLRADSGFFDEAILAALEGK